MFARNTKMLFRIHCLSLSNSKFEMQKGPYLCYVSIFPDPPNHNGIDMRHGSQWWNRLFGCETIRPTQKPTSMNLLQMSCMITWAWSFLTSKVVEAVKGQKHHFSWHFDIKLGSSLSAGSAYQRFKNHFYHLWLSASIQPPYLEF